MCVVRRVSWYEGLWGGAEMNSFISRFHKPQAIRIRLRDAGYIHPEKEKFLLYPDGGIEWENPPTKTIQVIRYF